MQSVSVSAGIPWADEQSWREAGIAVAALCSALGEREAAIRKIAGKISQCYQKLEDPMERLCGASCSSCQEVCCLRATLWYDLSDLLFIQLISAALPARQIYRLPTGACCNLGEAGCRLPRWRRPFICSWYLCGAQQAALRAVPERQRPTEHIEQLRELRKQLLAACVEAVTP